ncbi:MAG: hypothetical protein MRY32_08710 [Rickettsiales bacterium]|nr:hypothetical protein [Rickettsiales bacterium]
MSIQRFNFEDLEDFHKKGLPEDFEEIVESAEEIVEEEPPPPPTFSLEELETAKKLSFEEGRNAGIEDGKQQQKNEDSRRLQQIESICDQLTAELSEMKARHMSYLAMQSADLSQLVQVVAQKVAGDVVAMIPTANIDAMIDECLGVLVTQPRIILTVHPDLGNFMADFLRKKLAAAGVEADLVIHSDESMQIVEARMEWQSGAIERDMNAIWAQIEQKLQTIDFSAPLKRVEEETQALQPAEPQEMIDEEEKIADTEPTVSEVEAESAQHAQQEDVQEPQSSVKTRTPIQPSDEGE